MTDPAATDVNGENARDGTRKRRDPNEPSAIVGDEIILQKLE